ncbi:MAG: hypothetical protein GTO30_07600 [Acidobacteria bacterium]|nr:hypothetical protein [Acidobacteriota bacterium]NIQ84995.1 hypothetical protein [Acidobacteriota bacterium]
MHSRKEEEREERRKHRKKTSLERHRQRMKWMVAATVVLAIASAVVNFVILPGRASAPTKPAVATIPPVINVKGVDSAGTMMITRVDGWNELDDAGREKRVDRLGEIASESGFQMLMVVDEYGQGAAAWDQRAGTELVDTGR